MQIIKKILPWFILGITLLISKEFITEYKQIFVAFKGFKTVISPFILGIIIAYIANALMTNIQNKTKLNRKFAFLLTYTIFIGSILTIFAIIVPSIIKNIVDISKNIPSYTASTYEITQAILQKLEQTNITAFVNYVNSNMEKITSFAMNILDKSLNYIVSSFVSFTSSLTNFVISIIVSMYVSYDIKNFEKKIYDFTRALIGNDKTDKIAEFIYQVAQIFKKFFIGQMLDAIIVATICFIGLSFFKIPYAALLSLVTAVFNMIPYIGPILGGIPVVFIAFLDEPQKALWAIIFILILQQIEGNIIAPKILGDAVGISAFSILLAITLGGAYFGILGMFLAVPIFKIILILIEKFVQKRINEQN